MLSPGVTLWTDGGGKVRQVLKPVIGRETVAGWFAALGTATYQGIEPGQRSPGSTAARAWSSAARTAWSPR